MYTPVGVPYTALTVFKYGLSILKYSSSDQSVLSRNKEFLSEKPKEYVSNTGFPVISSITSLVPVISSNETASVINLSLHLKKIL